MKLSLRIAAFILPPLYRLWAATLRYEEIGREPIDDMYARGERFIICLWHGEIFAMWQMKRQIRLVALISRSKDGEFLSRVVTRLGFHLARGSSSRGGSEALRAAVKSLRDGYSPCVTMDGPRGPRHEIKDGVFYLAAMGDAWLTPIRVLYTRGKRFRSWDGFFLPLPFSRVRVAYEKPYKIETETLDKASLPFERARMKAKMDGLDRYAFTGYPSEPNEQTTNS